MGLIGKIIGGVTGGLLSGKAPELKQAKFSQKGEQALEQIKGEAAKTPEQLAAEAQAGAAEAGASFQEPEGPDSLGATPDDFKQAISNKYRKDYNADMAKLGRKSKVEAIDRSQANKDAAFQANASKRKVMQELQARKIEYNNAMNSARNSAIGSIFSNIGETLGAKLAEKAKPGTAVPLVDGPATKGMVS